MVIGGPGTGRESEEVPETTLTQTKTCVCQLKPAAELAMTPETNSTGRSRAHRSPNPASETSSRPQQARTLAIQSIGHGSQQGRTKDKDPRAEDREHQPAP